MGSFAEFAATLEQISRTSGKNDKVRILAGYLRHLDPHDAEMAARFATGRASRGGSAEETQVGHSTILSVVKEVTGISDGDVNRLYVKHGDLGSLTEEVIRQKKEALLFHEDLG